MIHINKACMEVSIINTIKLLVLGLSVCIRTQWYNLGFCQYAENNMDRGKR